MPSKRLYWSIIYLSILVLLASCQREVRVIEKVENLNSPALKRLFRLTDFIGNWQWIETFTYQRIETPTTQNSHLVEIAGRVLTGEYGAEKHYIIITNIIETYAQSVNLADLKISDELGQSVSLENILISDYEHSLRCIQETGSTTSGVIFCQIVIVNEVEGIYLTVYAPSNIDKKDLEEIINQALNTIIQQIEDNHIPTP